MSGRRRLYLDRSPGEALGMVTLDGRPERLLIFREGEPETQRLGARVAARVRRIERGQGSAFLDLGEGPDAVLPLAGHARGLAEGAAVEIGISAEARRGKGPVARLLGPASGAPALLAPAPSLVVRLQSYAPGEAIVEGAEARQAGDAAQDEALAVEHALPGGGSVAIEPTRALVAVDVDLGGRGGGDARRRTLNGNLAALREIARLLRLKGLGGLVVVDLAGAGQDGPALAAEAKSAFSPDEPGVALGPVSRFGTLTLALPHRFTPIAEVLLDADGHPSARTVAHRLVRALEREGRADPGGRLTGVCSPEVAAIARLAVRTLGPRFDVAEEVGRERWSTDIRAR
jgi:Ribonuclease G/E